MLAGRAEMLAFVEKLGWRAMSRAAPLRSRQTQELLESALLAQSDSRGRKSVILISEGFPSELARNYEKRIVRAAQVANVAIYFVNARSLGGWNPFLAQRWADDPASEGIGRQRHMSVGERRTYMSRGAEALASRTGGFTIQNNNDLAGAVQRVFAENRNYYLLGYRSSNPKRDGRFRTIKVRVARKGPKVRARKGYYAPTAEDSPGKPSELDGCMRDVLMHS